MKENDRSQLQHVKSMPPNGWGAEALGLKKKVEAKRSSSITLKSKDTNLPTIVSKKVLETGHKGLPQQTRLTLMQNQKLSYQKIFKYKENKSIDHELKRLQQFKCKNRELRKQLGGLQTLILKFNIKNNAIFDSQSQLRTELNKERSYSKTMLRSISHNE